MNAKASVEQTRKVALRLRKKIIERGKTPNLDGSFFIQNLIGEAMPTKG